MASRRPGRRAFFAETVNAPRLAGPLPMHLNSVALILSRVAAMGLGFLSWLVAARIFEPEEVGLASGTISAMMLCVQIALLGTGAAVILLFPRYQDEPADLLDTSIGVVALASLASGGLFLALASGIFRELTVVAAIPSYAIAFLVLCLFGTVGVLFDQISTALRRGDQTLVRGMLTGLVTLAAVAVLPLVTGTASSLAILAAWAAAGGITVAVGYHQVRQSVPRYRFRPRIRRRLAKEFVSIGLPNWGLTLAERAPGLIMPIIVTEILSPEANATWYAAWMMAWVVLIIPIQVGQALLAEASFRTEELGRVVRQGIALSLGVGAIGAGGAVLIGPLMLSLLGHSYAVHGATPLRILVLAVFPFAAIQAYFSVCRSTHRLTEAILTGVVSGGAGVAVAAAAAAYGLPGIAAAWLATQLVTGAWAVARLWALLGRQRAQSVTASAAASGEDHILTGFADDSATLPQDPDASQERGRVSPSCA